MNEDQIKRWLAGELSDSERKEFEGTEEFAKINKLMKAVHNFKAPQYDIESQYNKLSDKISPHNESLSMYKRISPVVRMAAIFIVALTISYFLYDNSTDTVNIQKALADQTELYLPDSSFVALNKGSQIHFSQNKWGEDREVSLNGEAFFRVKKGSQFKVKTSQGTVTVLGTEFGVKDRAEYYQVTCYSGLVKVIAGSNSIVLHPNSVFRIVSGQEESYTISDESMPDWFDGESCFKSVPLKFVVNELERQYKVKVQAQSVDLSQLFTGSFTHEDLELAIESITIPVNLNYKMNWKKTVITFEDK